MSATIHSATLHDAERRAATLAALPAEAGAGLDRLSAMLEALAADPAILPFAEFATTTLDIDAAAQPRLRRALRDQVDRRTTPAQRARMWTAVTRFLALDGAALGSLVDAPERGARGVALLRPLIPTIALRSLRAAALLVKWQAMHYGPTERDAWRRAAFAYALAERLGMETITLRPYPHASLETTVRDEFVRMVALAASSPGSLPAEQIEALDRLLVLLVEHLEVVPEPLAGTHYWIDLDRPKTPARYVRPLDARPGLRFVGGAGVTSRLEALGAAVAHDPELPGALGLEGACDAHDLHALIAHLGTHWGPKPPRRRDPHLPLRSGLEVVTGFDDVLDALVARDARAGAAPLPNVTRWTTENVSAGGLAAFVEPSVALRVGEMIAVRATDAPGADWRVGTIRRLEHVPERGLFVAVELVQGRAEAVEVVAEVRGERAGLPAAFGERAGSPTARGQRPDSPTLPAERTAEVAMLARDPHSDAAFLALRSGVHTAAQRYVAAESYRETVLVPDGMVRRGAGHDLLRCRVAER